MKRIVGRLEPDLRALPMCVQAFQFGEFPHRREGSLERSAVVLDDTRAPLELVNREAGKRGARAARRQGVVRAGYVIAQHCG